VKTIADAAVGIVEGVCEGTRQGLKLAEPAQKAPQPPPPRNTHPTLQTLAGDQRAGPRRAASTRRRPGPPPATI